MAEDDNSLSWWERAVNLIQRNAEALATFFARHIISLVLSKELASKEYLNPIGKTITADAKAEELLSTATAGVTSVRTRLHEEIREELEDAAKKGGIFGYLHWALITIAVFKGKVSAFMGGISALRAQAVNTDLKPSLAPIESLLRAEMLNPWATSFLDPIIEKWGLPKSSLDSMRSAMQQLPSMVDLMMLVNRKVIPESTAIAYMERQGISEVDAERLLQLRFYYPSPADWATLAGREAYEEDQIRSFGLDAGFENIDPSTYEKAGLTAETARQYWVAHWSNPSPQQLFEMIHRKAPKPDGTPFAATDVDDYVRLADINPFFGKALAHIAFRPLTRVDVRRMYADGVLDYDGILKSYTDLGYDQPEAKVMSDWTVKYTQRSERSLTRTQLEAMFELRQISRSQLAKQLELIGYPREQAETLSYLAAAKQEDKRLRSFIRRGEYEYKRSMATKAQVSSLLLDEGVEPDQLEDMFNEWDNEKVYEQALPSKDDVLSWLDSGRIDETEFRGFMRALRFTDENIDIYAQADGATLSKTDVLRLYDQREIMEERALSALRDLGYEPADALALIGPVTRRIERRDQLEQAQTDDG